MDWPMSPCNWTFSKVYFTPNCLRRSPCGNLMLTVIDLPNPRSQLSELDPKDGKSVRQSLYFMVWMPTLDIVRYFHIKMGGRWWMHFLDRQWSYLIPNQRIQTVTSNFVTSNVGIGTSQVRPYIHQTKARKKNNFNCRYKRKFKNRSLLLYFTKTIY